MRRLQVGGLPLPEIYICDNQGDEEILRETGIPFIKTKLSDIDIVKLILYRTLKRKFPRIKWDEVLGIQSVQRLNVIVPGGKQKDNSVHSRTGCEDGERRDERGHMSSDIAEDYREFDVNGYIDEADRYISVDEYCADEASHVNIETLQSLGFLPKFMDDAVDAIRINLENRMQWRECWNKRLGAAVGDIDYGYDAANLIILDISGSIPEGISATMLQLIESLRSQTNAELIITGTTSMYWSSDDELPDPKWIRDSIGYGNESTEFFKILREHVTGRHFGNVISFGDNDSPYYDWHGHTYDDDITKNPPLHGVRVDRVLHYHTSYKRETGYARWVGLICPDAEQVIDTSWCKVMC